LTDHAFISNIDNDDVKKDSKFDDDDNDDNSVDLQSKLDCWLMSLREYSLELFKRLRKHTIVTWI